MMITKACTSLNISMQIKIISEIKISHIVIGRRKMKVTKLQGFWGVSIDST